jgi:hypothetical protein
MLLPISPLLLLPLLLQHIDGINLFGLISILSLLFCIPAALWCERHLWETAWQAAVSSMGGRSFYQLLGLSGLFYHLYNQVGGGRPLTVTDSPETGWWQQQQQ